MHWLVGCAPVNTTPLAINPPVPLCDVHRACTHVVDVTETFGHLYVPSAMQEYFDRALSPAALRDELSHAMSAGWFVTLDGVVVGFAMVHPCNLPHADVTPSSWELHRLYVSKVHHGRGLGSMMLQLALQWIDEQHAAGVDAPLSSTASSSSGCSSDTGGGGSSSVSASGSSGSGSGSGSHGGMSSAGGLTACDDSSASAAGGPGRSGATGGRADVWIGVWSENYGAQRLYRRFGFDKAGEYEFVVGETRDREFIFRRVPVAAPDAASAV